MTVVVAVPESLVLTGSVVAVVRVAVLVIVELCTALALTFATMVKVATSVSPTSLLAKVIVPVPPDGTTSVRDQPGDTVEAETSVVLAGVASETTTVLELLGPWL